jgi:hypothetical protein
VITSLRCELNTLRDVSLLCLNGMSAHGTRVIKLQSIKWRTYRIITMRRIGVYRSWLCPCSEVWC